MSDQLTREELDTMREHKRIAREAATQAGIDPVLFVRFMMFHTGGFRELPAGPHDEAA